MSDRDFDRVCVACDRDLFPGHEHMPRPVDVPRDLDINAVVEK